MRWLTVFLLLILPSIAIGATPHEEPEIVTADEVVIAEFVPFDWSEGLHLLGGAGFSSSLYTSDTERRDHGLGAYFKTDLSYFVSDSLAVELSSGIEFNRVDAFLVWNTQFTLGLRQRVFNSGFVRLFGGKSPSVIFLNGNAPPEYSSKGIERLHFDGPVVGLSAGRFRQTPGKRVWFQELSFTVQRLEQENGIAMQGEVPIVLIQQNTTDHSTIYAVNFSIGTLFF